MFDGYLSIAGTEILNRARAAAYLKAMLPGKVEVLCEDEGLAKALGHTAYTTPTRDSAPWFTGQRVSAGKFLGLFPGKVEGAENSTREVQVTQLTSAGAIMTSPRYASKEMRFVATAFAMDGEAMEEGMAWLRDVLANDGCSDVSVGCTGRPIRLFAAKPTDLVSSNNFTRTFHRVEVTEGPLVTKKFAVKGFVMWEVEFTVTAGIPWAFTTPVIVGALNMDTATSFTDPPGEDCSQILNAYDDFVGDPYFTGISRPPRPPVILPPNIIDISSWRRKVIAIPPAQTARWGRVVPLVNVVTGSSDAQYLRLRFYKVNAGLTGCDYDGEFLISYLPANSVLSLNAITREATITVNGKTSPAGHLLFGSDGRPFLWPSLGCRHNYNMTADLMPGQPGVTVTLDTSVRD